MLTRTLSLAAAGLLLVGALWWSLRSAPEDVAPAPAAVVLNPDRPAAAPVAPAATVAPDVAPAPPALPDAPAAALPADDAASAGDTLEAVPPSDPAGSDGPFDEPAGAPDVAAGGNLDFSLDERDLPDPGDAGGGDVVGGPTVTVPSSYPIGDAAKYFVPREERRPGNLGGPPPLDFPGGPNDPDGAIFQPPSAPGD